MESSAEMNMEALDRIKRSPTYGNLSSAMDTVFSLGGWSISGLWPGDMAEDFRMKVDIGQIQGAAYLSAIETHTTGMNAWGPYGYVGINVPDPDGFFRFPDGRHGDALDEYYATPEERYKYRYGSSGEDLLKIVEYLNLLQRYLAWQPPTDPEILNHIRQSGTFINLTSAMNMAFGRAGWSVAELWPRGVAENFRVKVNIGQIQGAAYISVGGTQATDIRPARKYGDVGVSVPDPTASYVFPDGKHGDSLLRYDKALEKQKQYTFGADGEDLSDIMVYLRALQGYLSSRGNTPSSRE